MPSKCKCCDAKGSTADFLSALASLAFFVASHPAHFAFSKYRVTPEWTGRADRSSFKDLCKDCRLCAVGDGSVEGTDETHDEGDCECEYGEKQERPVNKRGRRRQRRQTQVRQERIQEKAEKSMANVQASDRRWCCRRRCHLLLHHPPFLPRAAWRCLQRRVARLHDKPNPGLPGAPHCLLAWLAAWPHRAMHA